MKLTTHYLLYPVIIGAVLALEPNHEDRTRSSTGKSEQYNLNQQYNQNYQYSRPPFVAMPTQRPVYPQPIPQQQTFLLVIKAIPITMTPQPTPGMQMVPYPTEKNYQQYQQPPFYNQQYLSTNQIYQTEQPQNNLLSQNSNFLNYIAQAVAQQYVRPTSIPNQYQAPAIVTGLENFSAEQQAQIKNVLPTWIKSQSTIQYKPSVNDLSYTDEKSPRIGQYYHTTSRSSYKPNVELTTTEKM